MRVRRIVVGLDGSPGSERAVEWAATLARDLNADVIAVHAVPTVVYGPMAMPVVVDDATLRDELSHVVEDEWCALLRKMEIPYRSVVETGSAAEVIMQVADREGAQLIVVGSRGRGGFAELLLGSVGQQLTHHSTHPIVIVPAGKS